MSAAERPLRADARRNQERLMAAAREAFAENGEAASLDDIAKRAGVGPGTLYRHFPTREALIAAVYREGIAGMAERAGELEALPPMEALTTFMHDQIAYGRAKRGLGVAVKATLASDSETMRWCRQTLRDAFGGLLRRAQEDGSVRADVDGAVVLKLVHGVVMATENAPDGDAERMLQIVVDGLKP
jgi:AcrR family transcriptional regulator